MINGETRSRDSFPKMDDRLTSLVNWPQKCILSTTWTRGGEISTVRSPNPITSTEYSHRLEVRNYKGLLATTMIPTRN